MLLLLLLAILATIKKTLSLSISMLLIEVSFDQFSLGLTLTNVCLRIKKNSKFQDETVSEEDMEIIQSLIMMGLYTPVRMLLVMISLLVKQHDLLEWENHKILDLLRMFQLL